MAVNRFVALVRISRWLLSGVRQFMARAGLPGRHGVGMALRLPIEGAGLWHRRAPTHLTTGCGAATTVTRGTVWQRCHRRAVRAGRAGRPRPAPQVAAAVAGGPIARRVRTEACP